MYYGRVGDPGVGNSGDKQMDTLQSRLTIPASGDIMSLSKMALTEKRPKEAHREKRQVLKALCAEVVQYHSGAAREDRDRCACYSAHERRREP